MTRPWQRDNKGLYIQLLRTTSLTLTTTHNGGDLGTNVYGMTTSVMMSRSTSSREYKMTRPSWRAHQGRYYTGVPACPALLRKVNSQMLITNKAVSDEEAQKDLEISSDKEETSSEEKKTAKPTKQPKTQSKKAVEAEKRRQKESVQVKRYTQISQTFNTHILTKLL